MWTNKDDIVLPKNAFWFTDPLTKHVVARFKDRTPSDYSVEVLIRDHNNAEFEAIMNALKDSKDPVENNIGIEFLKLYEPYATGVMSSTYLLDWYYSDYVKNDPSLPVYDESKSQKENMKELKKGKRPQKRAADIQIDDLFN